MIGLLHAGRCYAAGRLLAVEPESTTEGTAVSLLDSLRAHPLPKELAFAPAEYAARLAAVRAEMARQRLDVLLVGNSGNLCWLTGYDTVMPSGSTCAIVPLSGEIAVICPDLELSCVELYTEVREVEIEGWHTGRDVASLDRRPPRRRRRRGRADRDRAGQDRHLLLTPPSTPRRSPRCRLALPGREWVDATLPIPGERLIKSDAELAAMRLAGTRQPGWRLRSRQEWRPAAPTTTSPPRSMTRRSAPARR